MKSLDIEKLFLEHILNLKPYSSARDEYQGREGIFLDANENPFGSALDYGRFNRYPDPYQKELKKAISELKKIPIEQIFLGNGSDEPIDLLIRAFCYSGKDSIVQIAPTYGMYQVCAEIQDVKTISVLLDDGFELNVKNLINTQKETRSKIIFICSPNNPTGNAFEKEHILSIVKSVEAIVVVDQAYIDFCPDKSLLEEVKNYPNLVILQTFSKAWGLAALRVGMAFANERIIAVLNKIKYPYNLNILSQEMVLKALENKPRVERYVKQINTLKNDLIVSLSSIQGTQKIYHSDANFILVKFDNAPALYQYLIEKKIITRDRTKAVMCDNCIRITVGTSDENEVLVQSIKSFYSPE
jgi:histidinol-phosphate aminotransferase